MRFRRLYHIPILVGGGGDLRAEEAVLLHIPRILPMGL